MSSSTTLIAEYTTGSLLYRDYRCGTIHGTRLDVDEDRFFIESEPYFAPYSNVDDEPMLALEYPARYLCDLLEKCIDNYRRVLLESRRLPPDIYFEMYPGLPTGDADIDHLVEHMDETRLGPFLEPHYTSSPTAFA